MWQLYISPTAAQRPDSSPGPGGAWLQNVFDHRWCFRTVRAAREYYKDMLQSKTEEVGLVALAGALAVRESRWTGLGIGLAFVATPYLGVAAAVVAGMALLQRGNVRLLVISLVMRVVM